MFVDHLVFGLLHNKEIVKNSKTYIKIKKSIDK